MPGAIQKTRAELELSGALYHDKKRYQARINEPVPTSDIGRPPSHLSTERKKIWREVVRNALPGSLGNSDRLLLEQLTGLVWLMRSNPDKMSCAKMMLLHSLLTSFGMSPTSRCKVNAIPTKKQSALLKLINEIDAIPDPNDKL